VVDDDNSYAMLNASDCGSYECRAARSVEDAEPLLREAIDLALLISILEVQRLEFREKLKTLQRNAMVCVMTATTVSEVDAR